MTTEDARQGPAHDTRPRLQGDLEWLAAISQDFAAAPALRETLANAVRQSMVYRNTEAACIFLLDAANAKLTCLACAGRIVAFDRVLSGKSSKAVVALELRLLAGRKHVLNKTYQAEQVAADESLSAFAAAMEVALGRICADIGAVPGRRR